MNRVPARLLDLTRLLSRTGRTLTGVDRVERAYLQELLAQPLPVFGLVRTRLGYLLLDRAGMAVFAGTTPDGAMFAPDRLARLSRRSSPARQIAETLLRRHAVARCLPVGLTRMLRRALPSGTRYLNMGHSNLTDRVLTAIHRVPDATITVMIHDTIPLDWPDFQRAGAVPDFAAKLTRVSRDADLVLCPSHVVQTDLVRHFTRLGRVPPVVAIPLGVTPARPDPAGVPPGLALDGPYFVALGTIEPRKNHALLLDIWGRLGPDRPTLLICGSRGWLNADVFARLDAHPPGIVELPGLTDGAVAALLAGARALLFPSRAEGFGLPLAEAAALGTPVICGDLAICREVLGDVAVYLPLDDQHVWEKHVKSVTIGPRITSKRYMPPDWATHFKTALSMT